MAEFETLNIVKSAVGLALSTGAFIIGRMFWKMWNLTSSHEEKIKQIQRDVSANSKDIKDNQKVILQKLEEHNKNVTHGLSEMERRVHDKLEKIWKSENT